MRRISFPYNTEPIRFPFVLDNLKMEYTMRTNGVGICLSSELNIPIFADSNVLPEGSVTEMTPNVLSPLSNVVIENIGSGMALNGLHGYHEVTLAELDPYPISDVDAVIERLTHGTRLAAEINTDTSI